MRHSPSVARYRRKLVVALVTVGAALFVGCSGEPADEQDSMTEDTAHWDALRDELIANQGEYLLREDLVDSLPTDVEFVRYLDPDEWAEVHAQCLRDQGFHVEVTLDGGLLFNLPEDQQKALHEAAYRCDVQYPVHPRFRQRLSIEQIALLYEYYVDTLKPCLEAEGYEIEQPPSLETFAATLYEDSSWHPYNSVPLIRREEQHRLQQKCPMIPPTEVLHDR